jgi:hypothetical protein
MTLNKIPKIIWQTHEWEYSDLPQNFLAATMTWKNLNPDWEYRYVSAKERESYIDSSFINLYKMHDKVSQADLWRYLVTYKYGGVYSDMDSICTTPLTYMLDQHQNNAELVAMPIDANGYSNNSNFAIVNSSQIMDNILKNLVAYYKKPDWIQLFMNTTTTGEFWEYFTDNIKLHPALYYDVVFAEDPNLVSFNFDVVHSQGIKTTFNYDYPVNYYGENTSYFKLAKEHNWETHIY